MRKLYLFIIVLIATMVVSFGLTITLLNGCSFDRYVEVEDGDYVPVDTESIHDSPTADLIYGMHIDRENNSMKLMLEDGSIISSFFSARPKQDLPSGCPANLGSTKMEILDLEVRELAIGTIVINHPVLVRNCPDDPERVILREDGQIGGVGTACAQDDRCIHFKPGTPAEPMHSPRFLSENEKGLALDIAVSSPELESYRENNGSFQTELKWLARLCDESGSCTGWQVDYDWQADDNFKNIPEDANWYPAVFIRFEVPEQGQMLVAVDLNTERVIHVQKKPEITGPTASPSQEAPNITGWITDIQPLTGGNISGRILVEMDTSDGTSDKYWISARQDTPISDYRRGTQEIMAFSDLGIGLQVQVWFSGPVRESYPAQVDAAQIDIVLNEEFAIYLLNEDIKPSEMPALSHVELPETPIISVKDIVAYSKANHEIELTPEACDRLRNLEPPRVFVVAVARQPVYWATYWASWFSRSIEDGVVILKPLSRESQVIRIDLGYPAGMYFTGEDPRSDPILMKSLERTGKLSAVIGQQVPIEEIEKVE